MKTGHFNFFRNISKQSSQNIFITYICDGACNTEVFGSIPRECNCLYTLNMM